MNALTNYIYAQECRFRTLFAYRNKSWRNIPIFDNNEPLVLVPRDMCFPYYSKHMQIWPDERIFLRKGVYDRFLDARSFVAKNGYSLVVYDGWRPIGLQERLFWYYLKEFTVKKFSLVQIFTSAKQPEEIKEVFLGLDVDTQDALRLANRTYVSWPSSDPLCPSPHATGGAIDVWLHRDGMPVDLGVPFDWMEENAGAFYHLKFKREKFTNNDDLVCKCRNMLIVAMSRAGFTCYGPEIWHFNFGNQMHSLVSGGPAMYSYIEPVI